MLLGNQRKNDQMKTLLTIGGQTYLLPDSADAATVLKQLVGAVRVNNRTHYGPGETTEERYGEGYFSAQVAELTRSGVRIELVDNDEVLSQAEWDRRVKAEEERLAGKVLPKAA